MNQIKRFLFIAIAALTVIPSSSPNAAISDDDIRNYVRFEWDITDLSDDVVVQ